MSKYVKNLIIQDIARRLEGVEDALLVNVIGLDANRTVALRRKLRERNIGLLVVKSSMAKRATEGTPLAPALEEVEGPIALAWGDEDFVSLTKTIVALDKDEEEFPEFEARGGVLDGERLTPERVREISKWPSREEQLSLLVGQILGPARQLAAQLTGPGAQLASQIEQRGEEEGESSD